MPAEVGDWDESTTGEKGGRRIRLVGSTQDMGREGRLQQECSCSARDDTGFAGEEEVVRVFGSLTCFPGLHS